MYQQQSGFPRIGLRLAPLLMGAVAIAMFMMQSCQPGPFGRKQIVPLTMEQEANLGFQAFREVLQTSKVVQKGPVVDAVRQVTGRLVKAIDNPQFQALTKPPIKISQWNVEVVQSNEKNAFCLPGGKIVVYTGILSIAQTDAGLAVVLGHEISHALCRHGNERMGKQQIVNLGLGAVNGSLGDIDPRNRQQILSVINAGAKFGILKYSRDHESEADHMGLLLMAAAGYDPRESTHFWHRMQEQTKGASVPEFSSTHPSHETRIRDLERLNAEAESLYKSSGHHEKPQWLPISERAD